MKKQALFVYGSLCDKRLRERILQREVHAEPACLNGYSAYYLVAEPYPSLRRIGGAKTPGLLLSGIDAQDLQRLDRYEGHLYRRKKLGVCVKFSRRRAWVYLLRPRFQRHLGYRNWHL